MLVWSFGTVVAVPLDSGPGQSDHGNITSCARGASGACCLSDISRARGVLSTSRGHTRQTLSMAHHRRQCAIGRVSLEPVPPLANRRG